MEKKLDCVAKTLLELEMKNENKEMGENFADVAAEMISAYIEEAAHHFLSSRSRFITEDGRYFYNNEELKTFTKQYLELGGSIDKLHIGAVYNNNGTFLCWEVCRKNYYESQKKLGKDSCFFS